MLFDVFKQDQKGALGRNRLRSYQNTKYVWIHNLETLFILNLIKQYGC